MTSELKVDKITPASGTNTQIGESGDTITIPSGCTITNSGTSTGFGDTNHFNTTAFYAYLNNTQTVTDNTSTTVAFNTEVFDLGSAFNTSTYSYTPPSTGYYYFEFS